MIFKKRKDRQNKIKSSGRKKSINGYSINIKFIVWQTTIEFFSLIELKS